jgi:hypothetical protein
METHFLWKDNGSQVSSCPSLTDTGTFVPANFRGTDPTGFAVCGIDLTDAERVALEAATPEIHVDPWESVVWIPTNTLADHLPELVGVLAQRLSPDELAATLTALQDAIDTVTSLTNA